MAWTHTGRCAAIDACLRHWVGLDLCNAAEALGCFHIASSATDVKRTMLALGQEASHVGEKETPRPDPEYK
jgi:hypothetical protein